MEWCMVVATKSAAVGALRPRRRNLHDVRCMKTCVFLRPTLYKSKTFRGKIFIRSKRRKDFGRCWICRINSTQSLVSGNALERVPHISPAYVEANITGLCCAVSYVAFEVCSRLRFEWSGAQRPHKYCASELAKELHDLRRRCLSWPSVVGAIALLKRPSLRFQIDFSVDLGSIDRYVTQP